MVDNDGYDDDYNCIFEIFCLVLLIFLFYGIRCENAEKYNSNQQTACKAPISWSENTTTILLRVKMTPKNMIS